MSNTSSMGRGPATVSLNDEEGVKRILTDTIFGLWGLVNNLTRLRPSRRASPRRGPAPAPPR